MYFLVSFKFWIFLNFKIFQYQNRFCYQVFLLALEDKDSQSLFLSRFFHAGQGISYIPSFHHVGEAPSSSRWPTFGWSSHVQGRGGRYVEILNWKKKIRTHSSTLHQSLRMDGWKDCNSMVLFLEVLFCLQLLRFGEIPKDMKTVKEGVTVLTNINPINSEKILNLKWK